MNKERQTIPNEAAREIVIKMHPSLKDCTILGDRLTRGQLMALVIAGAEWQKTQMMKDAVEADVNTYEDLVARQSWAEFVVKMPTNKLGDKVRIIIVKEDNQ